MLAARPKHASAAVVPAAPSTGDTLNGESILADTPARKQVEEVAGEPAPSHKKVDPIRPPALPASDRLDEPPPPTAPVEKVPAAPKSKSAPKPGDVYPATEDKS
jgi:hypothetical protein